VRKRATRASGFCHDFDQADAEDLTEYFADLGVRVRYLHRRSSARAARAGARPEERPLDVLIGINLLREGLDIPEVSLWWRCSTPTRKDF